MMYTWQSKRAAEQSVNRKKPNTQNSSSINIIVWHNLWHHCHARANEINRLMFNQNSSEKCLFNWWHSRFTLPIKFHCVKRELICEHLLSSRVQAQFSRCICSPRNRVFIAEALFEIRMEEKAAQANDFLLHRNFRGKYWAEEFCLLAKALKQSREVCWLPEQESFREIVWFMQKLIIDWSRRGEKSSVASKRKFHKRR